MAGFSFETELDLTGASITGEIDMRGASFVGHVQIANALQVGGDLPMSDNQNKASFNKVDLTRANDLGSARHERRADSLQVGQYLSIRNAQCAQEVKMNDGHIGSNLDLHGATLLVSTSRARRLSPTCSSEGITSPLPGKGRVESPVPWTCTTRMSATW
jgi:hypothetical protein